MFNQDQIIDGTSVCNDQPQQSKSQTLQICKIVFKISHRKIFVHAVGLQKSVEFIPGFETEQTAKFWAGEVSLLIILKRQFLKGAA